MMAPAESRRRKRRSSSYGASLPVELPDDLLTEILLRLPAEAVHKFQSVCRTWGELSSTPYFVETHYMRQGFPVILLEENTGCKADQTSSGMEVFLIEKREEKETDVIPRTTSIRPACIPAESWHTYHVCFSYNGLVVFRGTSPPVKEKGLHSSLTDFVIYNPVNQDTVRILTRGHGLGGQIYGMFLHPVLKTYCILWGLFQDDQVQFKMLSLGSQPQWKEIEAGSSVSHRPKLPPVLMDDVLYWIVGSGHIKRRPYICQACCNEFIMAFDIRREEFSVMPHPGPIGCGPRHDAMDLLKMDRFLSFIQYSRTSHSTTIINIWILTDVAERIWVKSHSIDTKLQYLGYGNMRGIAVVNGELLIQQAYERLHALYACNLEHGSIRKFGWEYSGYGRALTHFKSLVSLRNFKPVIRMQPARLTRSAKDVF